MCHSITILPDHHFYTYFSGLPNHEVYNVGIKLFSVEKNKIGGNFDWNVRSCKEIDSGLEILSVLQEQGIHFHFCPATAGALKIQMKLGAHIHSFSKERQPRHSTLISLEPSNPLCEDGPCYRLRIPVLFGTKNVTFFDGEDVSVSRFVIPNLETMLEIFGEKGLRLNGYKNTPFQGMWRPLHEKLYKEAYARIPKAIRAMKRDARLEQAAIKGQRGTR